MTPKHHRQRCPPSPTPQSPQIFSSCGSEYGRGSRLEGKPGMKKLLAAAGASVCVLGILNPITANKVSGNGASWISVTGTWAEVKIQVNGLLDGAPHAQHIHIDAQGKCPTKPAQHNGLPSINVADGAPLYGGIGTSLTNAGDTSPAAALAVERFPSTGPTPIRGPSNWTRTWLPT